MLLRNDYVTVNTVSGDERPSHEAITQVSTEGLVRASTLVCLG